MWNRRGQSTVEYAVIIAVVIAALLAIQLYMKRGLMGKLRESTDQIGEQFNPYHHAGTVNRTVNAARTEATVADGTITTTFTNDRQGQTGDETLTELFANEGHRIFDPNPQ